MHKLCNPIGPPGVLLKMTVAPQSRRLPWRLPWRRRRRPPGMAKSTHRGLRMVTGGPFSRPQWSPYFWATHGPTANFSILYSLVGMGVRWRGTSGSVATGQRETPVKRAYNRCVFPWETIDSLSVFNWKKSNKKRAGRE